MREENMKVQAEIEDVCSERYDLREEQFRTALAIRNGFEIVKNSPNRMTFDLDSEEALSTFKYRVQILERKGFSPAIQITKSKSGNYHAVVDHVVPLTEPMRIAIQACLGSDWKREFIGILRLIGNPESVSMLFRPPVLEVLP